MPFLKPLFIAASVASFYTALFFFFSTGAAHALIQLINSLIQ